MRNSGVDKAKGPKERTFALTVTEGGRHVVRADITIDGEIVWGMTVGKAAGELGSVNHGAVLLAVHERAAREFETLIRQAAAQPVPSPAPTDAYRPGDYAFGGRK